MYNRDTVSGLLICSYIKVSRTKMVKTIPAQAGKELFLEVILKMSPNRLGPPCSTFLLIQIYNLLTNVELFISIIFHRWTFLQHGWPTGKAALTPKDDHYKYNYLNTALLKAGVYNERWRMVSLTTLDTLHYSPQTGDGFIYHNT